MAWSIVKKTWVRSSPLASSGMRMVYFTRLDLPGRSVNFSGRTEIHVTVPGLVFVPAGGPARKPAVLYVHGAG